MKRSTYYMARFYLSTTGEFVNIGLLPENWFGLNHLRKLELESWYVLCDVLTDSTNLEKVIQGKLEEIYTIKP